MMLFIITGITTNFAGKYCHATFYLRKDNCHYNGIGHKLKILRPHNAAGTEDLNIN